MSVEIEQDALYMMPWDPQYPLSFTVNRRQKPINRKVASDDEPGDEHSHIREESNSITVLVTRRLTPVFLA